MFNICVYVCIYRFIYTIGIHRNICIYKQLNLHKNYLTVESNDCCELGLHVLGHELRKLRKDLNNDRPVT